MKKKVQIAFLGVLGLVLAGMSGYHLYVERENSRKAEEAAKRLEQRNLAELERQKQIQAQLKAQTEPLPPSLWMDARYKPFMDAMAKAAPAVVVVPVMNLPDKPGFDASARVAFARALAGALAAGGRMNTPDPALLFAALGEPRAMADRSAI